MSTDQTGILKILKFTNNLTNEEVVLEECSNFYEILNGYYVSLPKKYFSDMKFYLNEKYGKYSEIIEESFSGSDEKISQICCIARGNDTYTDMFIRSAGGADNLIGDGVSTRFGENELENVEEEEMYKELYEKVKKELEEVIELKDKELISSKELTEKLKLELEMAQPCKEIFDNFDMLEEEDLGLVLEVLDRDLSSEDYNKMVFDILAVNAGDENSNLKDLKILKIYINQIVEWLNENHFLG